MAIKTYIPKCVPLGHISFLCSRSVHSPSESDIIWISNKHLKLCMSKTKLLMVSPKTHPHSLPHISVTDNSILSNVPISSSSLKPHTHLSPHLVSSTLKKIKYELQPLFFISTNTLWSKLSSSLAQVTAMPPNWSSTSFPP